MTAARFVHCRCGHAKERHEIPGFEGECVADGCKCQIYRVKITEPAPVTSPPTLRTVPTPAPAPAPTSSTPTQAATFEQLVGAGKRSGVKRTVALAEKIETQLLDLHARVVSERQAAEKETRVAAEREAARREVEELKAKLAAAQARLRGNPTPPASTAPPTPGDGTCPECGQGGLKNVGAHRFRSHGHKAG